MAEENRSLQDVIDRLRAEGALTRNTGSNSIKTVKDVLKGDREQDARTHEELLDAIMESAESINKNNSRIYKTQQDNLTLGDEKELRNEEIARSELQIELLERIAIASEAQIKLLKGMKNTGGGGLGINPIFAGGAGLLAGLGAGAGAGIGIGLSALGIGGGIAIAAGGIGLAISTVMQSFDDFAEGMERINALELDEEVFEQVGRAIGNLVEELSIGEAIGLSILSGVSFQQLADGIETLNNTKFDPAQLEKVGEALDALAKVGFVEALSLRIVDDTDFHALAKGLNYLGSQDFDLENIKKAAEGLEELVGSVTDVVGVLALQAIDDNLIPLANGINRLNEASKDLEGNFVANMQTAGEGLRALADSQNYFMSFLGISGLQAIDDNLKPLADGINALNTIDPVKFVKVAALIGPAFDKLLDGTDDLFGTTGLQAIDDNLKPLADGLVYFANKVSKADAEHFADLGDILGGSFENLLDGTDDLFGTTGLQAIDDNLVKFADGVHHFANKVSLEDAQKLKKVAPELKDAMADLLLGHNNLLGAIGFQAIDDNLEPYANGIGALNSVGKEIDIANFEKITEAMQEMRKGVEAISDLNVPIRNMGMNIPFDKIVNRALDTRDLIRGLTGEIESVDFRTVMNLPGFDDNTYFDGGILGFDKDLPALQEQLRGYADTLDEIGRLTTDVPRLDRKFLDQQSENIRAVMSEVAPRGEFTLAEPATINIKEAQIHVLKQQQQELADAQTAGANGGAVIADASVNSQTINMASSTQVNQTQNLVGTDVLDASYNV